MALFELLNADGQLAPIVLGNGGTVTANFLRERPAHVAGSWTLVIDPSGNAVGSETFTLRQLSSAPPQ